MLSVLLYCMLYYLSSPTAVKVLISTFMVTNFVSTEAKPKGLVYRISGDTPNLKFSGTSKSKFATDFPKLITPAAAQAAHAKFQ